MNFKQGFQLLALSAGLFAACSPDKDAKSRSDVKNDPSLSDNVVLTKRQKDSLTLIQAKQQKEAQKQAQTADDNRRHSILREMEISTKFGQIAEVDGYNAGPKLAFVNFDSAGFQAKVALGISGAYALLMDRYKKPNYFYDLYKANDQDCDPRNQDAIILNIKYHKPGEEQQMVQRKNDLETNKKELSLYDQYGAALSQNTSQCKCGDGEKFPTVVRLHTDDGIIKTSNDIDVSAGLSAINTIGKIYGLSVQVITRKSVNLPIGGDTPSLDTYMYEVDMKKTPASNPKR